MLRAQFATIRLGVGEGLPLIATGWPVDAAFEVFTEREHGVADVGDPCVCDLDCGDGNICTTDTCEAGVCAQTMADAGTLCPGTADFCDQGTCDGSGVCSGGGNG